MKSEAQIQAEKDQTNGKALTFSVKNESDKDGWIMRFDWDFGDGITSYGKTVSHTYEQPGIYQVKLFLQDNLAGKTQYILNVEIK